MVWIVHLDVIPVVQMASVATTGGETFGAVRNRIRHATSNAIKVKLAS